MLPDATRPREPRGHGPAAVVAALVLAALLVRLAGEPAARLLRYERAAVLSGEAWRLLTAHLVHLGWTHLALNAAGLALLAVLLGAQHAPRHWAAVAVVSSLGVGLGLLIGSPQVAWYVGLSGTAHGMAAAGGVALARTRTRRSAGAALLAVLAAKIAWEQWRGAAPAADAALGGSTIVDAHLYGALAGLAAALLRRRA